MELVKITLKLPADLVEQTRQLGVLTDDLVAELLRAEVERRQSVVDFEEDEVIWETQVLLDALGDALDIDGKIDYDKLRSRSSVVSLDDL